MSPFAIRSFRLAACVAIALCIAGCASPTSSQRVTLSSLADWRQPIGDWQMASAIASDSADAKKLVFKAGNEALVNGPAGRTVNLLSQFEHGDVEAHIEFMVPKNSNSGVYFQSRYEVQILDSWGVAEPKYGDCGGIYGSCSEPKPDYPGKSPALNASRPPGEWQTFDVVFRAPRFDASGRKVENARFVKVTHNGKVIHENVEVPRPTCAAHSLDEKAAGPVMLQGDHGPIAYRNIHLKPLRLP